MKNDAISIMKLKSVSAPHGFLKNWAYLLSSSFFCQILGMFAMIRVARVLAPAGYGYFNLVQTTAGIGMILAGLGMRNVIIRDCARDPEKTRALYSASLFARILFGLIVAIGIILYSFVSANGLPLLLSSFVVVILFGQIIWDTAESISYGRQRMELSSWVNALGSVLWFLWVWTAPSSLLTIEVVSLSFAVLNISKAGRIFWQVQHIIPAASTLDKKSLQKEVRYLVKDSLPFYWLALLTMTTNQLPILILAERSNSEQVGLFNIGFRLLNPLQLLIGTGLSVLYPYLSKANVQNKAQYMQAIGKALKMTVVIGSGVALVVSLFRVEIVRMLFGTKYISSAESMAFQCWYTVIYSILCLIGTSLGASDKQRWLALLSTVYTIVALPIIWYGAAFGATGLAAGMTAGALINMIYHWYFFKKSLPDRLQLRVVIRLLIVIFGAMLCSWVVPADYTVAKVVIAGIIIVGMAMVLLKEGKSIGRRSKA